MYFSAEIPETQKVWPLAQSREASWKLSWNRGPSDPQRPTSGILRTLRCSLPSRTVLLVTCFSRPSNRILGKQLGVSGRACTSRVNPERCYAPGPVLGAAFSEPPSRLGLWSSGLAWCSEGLHPTYMALDSLPCLLFAAAVSSETCSAVSPAAVTLPPPHLLRLPLHSSAGPPRNFQRAGLPPSWLLLPHRDKGVSLKCLLNGPELPGAASFKWRAAASYV